MVALNAKIVILSAGSLAVALVALLFGLFLSLIAARMRQLPWVRWGAVLSFVTAVYAIASFCQQNTSSLQVNQLSELVQYTTFVVLVHSVYAFTFSFLGIDARRYHLVFGLLHGVLIVLLWTTRLILTDQMVARNLIWLQEPYFEPDHGPLGGFYLLYAALTGAYALRYWLSHWRRQPYVRTFTAGLAVWGVLAVNDALAGVGMTTVCFLMEYGFLAFSVSIMAVTLRRSIQLYEVAQSSSEALQAEVDRHRQTARALAESEAHLAYITDGLPALIAHVAAQRRFLFVNRAFCRFFGMAREEIIGREVAEILSEDAYRMTTPHREKTLAGTPASFEGTLVDHEGRERIMNVSMIPNFGDDGLVTSYLTLVHDVTRRKAAEEALRESEARYRQLAENLTEEIWLMDRDRRYTYVSPAVLRLKGYAVDEAVALDPEQELTPRSYAEISPVLDRLLADEAPPVASDEPTILELEQYRKDGSTVWTEVTMTRLRSDSGEPIGVLGITRDISDRRAARQELRRAKRQAEEANQAKSVFLANMSHEIRTPLSAIVGMAELFIDTELDEHQRGIIRTIGSEAASLLDIVNDILDFSKIEAGKLSLEEAPFDLRGLIDSLADSTAFRVGQKDVEVVCHLPAGFPQMLVGDVTRLRQVLTNLLSNAVKFTSSGEVVVTAQVGQEDRDRLQVRFEVRDTGIGIPADRQQAIFDSFTQADGSTTRKYGGTGLGTTISRQIVELMGGEIGVDSTPGEGSRFWFSVELGKPQQPRSIGWPQLDDRTVLVVDSNPSSRDVVEEYLQFRGCRVITTDQTGQAAVMLDGGDGNAGTVDLILIDHRVCSAGCGEHPIQGRSAPVPVVSLLPSPGARCSPADRSRLGVSGCLTKPVKRDELYRAVDRALGIGSAATESAPAAPRRSVAPAAAVRRDLHLLLAEDYPTSQQVALAHLRGAGYLVDLVSDGKQAVDAFRDRHYSLVLMDVQMPVMDGFTATRLIRETESNTTATRPPPFPRPAVRTPVIAMTAHAMKGYRERCLAAGMDDYIAKPLRRKELLAMIEKWTSPTQQPRSQEPPEQEVGTEHREDDTPLNMAVLLEELDGDRQFVKEVSQDFVDRLRTQITTLHRAFSDRDSEVVTREAHAIKGGAANLTADRLSSFASELELLGMSGSLDGGEAIIGEIEREHSRLARFLKTM